MHELLERALNIHRHYVVIYHQHAYTQMPLVSFTREVLQMQPQAQAKALKIINKLEESMLTTLDNLCPP